MAARRDCACRWRVSGLPLVTAKLAILISGRGSNMQSIVEACATGEIDAEIALVASDNAKAAGLQWAEQRGIATAVVRPKDHPDRRSSDQALAQVIDEHGCTHLLLAGYMRILSEQFVTHFLGRSLNIHPSLLPKYKGLHTHERALEAGDSVCGATVHFVSPALDSGPAVIQAAIPIQAGDDAERLAVKVLPFEHKMYPTATQWLVSGRLELKGDVAWLDNQELKEPMQLG